MFKYIILYIIFFPITVFTQSIRGKVVDNKDEPLIGANIHWINTTIGTSVDVRGEFEIPLHGITDKRIIISYVGYESDTIIITNQISIKVLLKEKTNLDEFIVEGDGPDTYISSIDPIKTEVITKAELTKAACCDLAGCFDTQGSVQPTTTNIVTNAKELRILGLSGVYNQVLIDGLPLVQGLSYTYGISTIPGTLVDNIYISKGANSVLQGYESISGQINVELKEPDNAEKFLFNAYTNNFLEKQLNTNYSHKWKKWSTIIAAHTTQPANKFDRDEDNFLDLPLLTRYSLYNKWKYGNQNEWGWHSRISLRYVNEKRVGGQTEFSASSDKGTMNSYGQTVQFSQPEFYTKTGYRFNDKHHLVFLGSAFQQDQSSYFGTTKFIAEQINTYTNFQHELTWNKNHTLKTGISYRYMNLDENLSFGQDTLNRSYDGRYIKNEQIPGAFLENTFNWKDHLISFITGVRVDNHNSFGTFVTPRALFKYNFSENTTARISAGTGWRTLNLFSENTNLLASSRDVIITEVLNPEQAVNYGANLTHKVYGKNIESQLTFDFYRTQFLNQIFPDYNTDPTKAYISNFTGESISNGFQGELGLEFFEKVGIKIAYNYLDVYRIINGNKTVLPFNPTHRVTGTFSFNPLNKKWHFDMNIHWYGKQELAQTSSNPIEYQLPEVSKPYTVINAQFTKSWERIDLYVGCENIFDFRQKQPILGWQNPFGSYFDTSSVWGPTRGREVYFGLKFKIE
jgi:outer membrane receptor for ferrienterochelin and colicin